MKKTKWWGLLAAGMMTLALAACGGNESAGAKSSGSNSGSSASNYPTKPITIVAPSGAGGGWDLTARAITKVLDETGLVKQTMTVENKPGGGGAVCCLRQEVIQMRQMRSRRGNIKTRRVDYPIKSKGYRKKSTFPVECEQRHKQTQEVLSMNKHTTLPNLMQKLVSDEEIQLIAEAVGYRDSSRTFTLRELIHFFLLAAMHQWKSFRHGADVGPLYGLPR
ncbi:hypothetical protein P9859_11540, partial [Geobacillus stearothermophilus]|nr:hypothetical protein [Geobacillus stearothermophilus]